MAPFYFCSRRKRGSAWIFFLCCFLTYTVVLDFLLNLLPTLWPLPAFVDWTVNQQDWGYFHSENADYFQVWTKGNQMLYQEFDENKSLENNNIFCLESIWLLTGQFSLLPRLSLTKALWSRWTRCYFPILQMQKLSPADSVTSQKSQKDVAEQVWSGDLVIPPSPLPKSYLRLQNNRWCEWPMASSGIMYSSMTSTSTVVLSTRVIITSSFWLPKTSPPAIHQNAF